MAPGRRRDQGLILAPVGPQALRRLKQWNELYRAVGFGITSVTLRSMHQCYVTGREAMPVSNRSRCHPIRTHENKCLSDGANPNAIYSHRRAYARMLQRHAVCDL